MAKEKTTPSDGVEPKSPLDASELAEPEQQVEHAPEALEQTFFEGAEEIEEAAAKAAEEDALTPLAHLSDEPLWGEQKDPVVPPKWQPLLPLAMILLSLFVMSSFQDDIQYFFSSRKPIKLGSISEGCDKAFYSRLRHNRFVSIKGVLGQPGMTAQARVRFQQQNYVVAMGCSLMLSITAAHYKRVALSQFDVVGRSMKASLTGAVEPLRKYYGPSGLLDFGNKTFIIYVNEHPNHQWWILIIYLALGILLVYNAKALSSSIWRNWIKGEASE